MTDAPIVTRGIQRAIPTDAERADCASEWARAVFPGVDDMLRRFVERRAMSLVSPWTDEGAPRCVCGRLMAARRTSPTSSWKLQAWAHVEMCPTAQHAAWSDRVRAWAATYDWESTGPAIELVARILPDDGPGGLSERLIARFEAERRLFAAWSLGYFEASLSVVPAETVAARYGVEWLDGEWHPCCWHHDDGTTSTVRATFATEADAEAYIWVQMTAMHCGEPRENFRIVEVR